MYSRIVVPLDGSPMAARAIRPALVLAEASDAPLLAVSCLVPGEDAERRRVAVQAQLDGHGAVGAELRLPTATGAVAPVLAELVEEEPGPLVVMASVARPHTAAIVGSVAEELMHRSAQPLLLVGPHAEPASFRLRGPVLVPVDGSPTSEAAVPLAGAWAVAFHLHPWVVSVLDERSAAAARAAAASGGPFETAYVQRLARRLEQEAGIEVDFDVLQGDQPAAAVVADARRRGVAVICASTHGRTGARRVALGSVAMSIVHHAPCPVLVIRPPRLAR